MWAFKTLQKLLESPLWMSAWEKGMRWLGVGFDGKVGTAAPTVQPMHHLPGSPSCQSVPAVSDWLAGAAPER